MNALIIVVQTCQLLLSVAEHVDRYAAYLAARRAANARGKPLLNVGCPSAYLLSHPCGDVCLDIDPGHLALCRSARPTYGDVRAIPYADSTFGAALCSHVLEHMRTVADAERALAELQRVADVVYICAPSRLGITHWLHPDHYLWVDRLPDGRVRFTQRYRREVPLLQRIWEATDRIAQKINGA